MEFVSEYAQEGVDKSNEISDTVQGSQEKTTETDPKNTTNENANNTKPKESSERKKITLRRISPTKEKRSLVSTLDTSAKVDNDKDNTNVTRKITLKRLTSDEKTVTTVKVVEEPKRRSSVGGDVQERKRKFSVPADERAQDTNSAEEIPCKPVKRVRLIRSKSVVLPRGLPFATDSNDSDGSTLTPAKPLRKPIWGKSNDWLNNLTASMYKIDVETIKIVCPTVKFLNENEVKLESVPKERKKSESENAPGGALRRRVSLNVTNDARTASEGEEEGENGRDTSEDDSERETSGATSRANIIAMNRKISIVDDTAAKLAPPPSPAKNPVSNVLFVSNLVRPFTVKQLRELLERTGKIQEDGFWTDRIKSKCYVQYETEEEAETTRNALHGINWPIGNGKKLIIDYATVEDLRKAQNPTPAVQQLIERKHPEKENWTPEIGDKFREKERFTEVERRRRSSERDTLRVERRTSGSRSKDRTREKKQSHRSYTPEGHAAKRQKKDEPAPQKLMDDLFLKTKATPSIYWQPLSPEEIATKQKQRLVRMEEHKRRIEQNRDRRIREIRRPPFRRR